MIFKLCSNLDTITFVVSTMKLATWVAETCCWLLCNKITSTKPQCICWCHFMHTYRCCDGGCGDVILDDWQNRGTVHLILQLQRGTFPFVRTTVASHDLHIKTDSIWTKMAQNVVITCDNIAKFWRRYFPTTSDIRLHNTSIHVFGSGISTASPLAYNADTMLIIEGFNLISFVANVN